MSHFPVNVGFFSKHAMKHSVFNVEKPEVTEKKHSGDPLMRADCVKTAGQPRGYRRMSCGLCLGRLGCDFAVARSFGDRSAALTVVSPSVPVFGQM